MHINSINTTNNHKSSFRARVNLNDIADKIKDPVKTEKDFALATKDYPNDRLELHSAPDRWLYLEAVDESNMRRAIDLPPEEVEELLKCPQETFTDKLVLAFKTLSFGIKRDNEIKEFERSELRKNPSAKNYIRTTYISDIENKRTFEMMKDMLKDDDILSEAYFYN